MLMPKMTLRFTLWRWPTPLPSTPLPLITLYAIWKKLLSCEPLRFQGSFILTASIITAKPAQTSPILFLTSYWAVAFQRQQTNTKGHTAKECTEERILTSSHQQNQCLRPPTEPEDWDMTRTWTPERFQKRRVCCPERSSAEAPYHILL